MENLKVWWRGRNLAQQYTVAGTLVLIAGMLLIGSWVAREIENAVTQNTAASTALYMDSFVAPHLQELGTGKTLSPVKIEALDQLLVGTEIGKRIVAVKVWKENGFIAYSSRKGLVGKYFPVSEHLERAWSGVISAEFHDLGDEEVRLDNGENIPILEMYSPIREPYTGRIIAVAEFYSRADQLDVDLFRSKRGSWIVVGAVTLVMLGLLSIIVLRGSNTIERQRQSLIERIDQLSNMRDRLKFSSKRATEFNEQFLRRLGSELHDGPAQLIALALLRLDSIQTSDDRVQTDSSGSPADVEIIRSALADSLREIRGLSADLILPEIESGSLKEGLLSIIATHEQRTEIIISREIGSLPEDVSKLTKMCIYRMVQEGLNNAFHHAGDVQTYVRASQNQYAIEVEISDSGPGFDTVVSGGENSGLGLRGLRERIESSGGSFTVRSAADKGTSLIASFHLQEVQPAQ